MCKAEVPVIPGLVNNDRATTEGEDTNLSYIDCATAERVWRLARKQVTYLVLFHSLVELLESIDQCRHLMVIDVCEERLISDGIWDAPVVGTYY